MPLNQKGKILLPPSRLDFFRRRHRDDDINFEQLFTFLRRYRESVRERESLAPPAGARIFIFYTYFEALVWVVDVVVPKRLVFNSVWVRIPTPGTRWILAVQFELLFEKIENEQKRQGMAY